MAVFSCKDFSKCKDPASPVQNLTSESSDGPTFIGLSFPWIDSNNPVGGNGGDNDPPPSYFAGGCFTICESQISQEDADRCAQRAAFICSHSPPSDVPPPVIPPSFFFNNLQVCNISCGDGTTFSYRVFPGTFVDTSQAGADEQAGAFACEQGARALICLNSIPNGCFGQPYSATVQTSAGGGRSFIFTITAGSLPPGLTMTQTGINSAVISGTISGVGNYAFTVRATESNGNFMEKTYAINVLAITNTPTTASVGSPYNFQFTASGGTAPYTFFLASGALPAGLTLASDGTISGTPTTVETTSFEVSVTDSSP